MLWGRIFITLAVSPVLFFGPFWKGSENESFCAKTKQSFDLMTIRYLREWEICFWKNQCSTPAEEIRFDIGRIFICRPLQGYAAELSAIWQHCGVGT